VLINEINSNLLQNRPEHRAYSSCERKNKRHVFPFDMDPDEIENDNLEADNLLDKRLTRKVDCAISFTPGEGFDKDFKLYVFLCEAKKPSFEHQNNDYDKLIRLMHDSYNSILIYFSKKARLTTKKLIDLFQEIIIVGLHIRGIYNFISR
jgi:hypothetical protein